MAEQSDGLVKLSQTYYSACGRMHEACTQLYESLHSSDGSVNADLEHVYDKVSEYRKGLLIEADLIREAVRQYHEAAQS